MNTDFDITIVGAGVVGLAIAARLSRRGERIVVLEKHNRFGQETSSRNSEVIHSGIYYPPGSLKAILCVKGREMLYEYCKQHEVRFNRCGKLVVATTREEEDDLAAILENAKSNGVDDGRIIEADEIARIEPNIRVRRAICFPSSGIVDSHGLMKSLETEAVTSGVTFAYGNELTGMRRIDGGDDEDAYELETKTADDEAFSFTSRIVINAAGLYSDRVAAMAAIAADDGNTADSAMATDAANAAIDTDGGMTGSAGMGGKAEMPGVAGAEGTPVMKGTDGSPGKTGTAGPAIPGYKLHFLKGEYFRIGNGKNRLVNGLIYPVPDKYVTSLGVHVTIDLDGGAKLGPNAIYLEDGVLDYSVDAGHRDAFYESARKFLPFIEPDDLHPDQAGVRPKLQKPGEPFHDFVIKDEADAGLPGLINLVGIESPGLTACLAIAEYVEELLHIADR